MRALLQVKADRGDAAAMRELAGPEIPEWLDYLHGWLHELHGRSGVGMNGLAPLSHSTIDAWARLKRLTIEPHEVDALLWLDGIMLNPEHRHASDTATETPRTVASPRAWPSKKPTTEAV